MRHFANIYDVLDADTSQLTIGEASHWLRRARLSVAETPVSNRSKEQNTLLNQLRQIHKDLHTEFEEKLAAQLDSDALDTKLAAQLAKEEDLANWSQTGSEYIDDPIHTGVSTRKGLKCEEEDANPSSVLEVAWTRWTEFKTGETEADSRSSAARDQRSELCESVRGAEYQDGRLQGCPEAVGGGSPLSTAGDNDGHFLIASRSDVERAGQNQIS